MTNKRVKVYTYTRVSTDMQKDGYSLDAQKNRIKQYAKAFDYEIIREYEDAGKSGKAIEGRPEFKMMLEDIESNKDGVSFVIVFKLSRFGRNSLDILNTIQYIQDNNVNLISVEEGIDSSKETGKLLITILSAVSEIERENILTQTMEGRKQKAREGKWNGGFAPYGYKLIEGKLVINDKEAESIKIIFDKYVNTTMGANGVAKYLEQQGIRKIPRQNGKSPLFSASLIRRILDNEVYYGKITYGKRTKKKILGTRNEYQTVNQKDYLIADGIHKAIIDEKMWIKAQNKRKDQASKYEHINKGKNQKTHLLSGILRCPICGAGMYGNKSSKYKDGKKYKDYYYYGCKHREKIRGHACNYSKQIAKSKLDKAVGEIISAAAGKQKFVESIEKKIKIETDTNQMNNKIDNIKKTLRQYLANKRLLENQIDSLNFQDKHYEKKFLDLQRRLDKMYDNIYDTEIKLDELKDRKKVIDSKIINMENIYLLLQHFDQLYNIMEDTDKRALLSALVKEVHIYEEEKTNGQWLKKIIFNLPLIAEDKLEFSLDNKEHVEVVTLLTRSETSCK